MNQQKLKSAIEEARRFIAKAQEAINEQEKTKYGNCPRENGAARRASMDLTRELAKLRKPM